jgi:hypothetical protein
MPNFNTHFSKTYHRIHIVVRPNDAMNLLYYLEIYDEIFDILLGEKYVHNLEEAQATAIKLERNILATYRFPLIHVPDQPGKVTLFNDIQTSTIMRVEEFIVIEKEHIYQQIAPYQVSGDE